MTYKILILFFNIEIKILSYIEQVIKQIKNNVNR